ncbi:MAG: peptidase M23 [Flavobacteriaceae bacterium]|nr:peptidase M23 [Flavobacteriaceae bacterium]
MKFESKKITLLILLFSVGFLYSQKNQSKLTPPLDIPLALSGTFGEIRSSHFHAGLDIKTGGKQGLKVRSVLDGKVSRIRVALSGYGKALYVDHPNGTTSVYAHLKSFSPKIESYIKKAQYEKKSYVIEKFPKNELLVLKGEIIGFSGNTGGSTGPHLHFEIRDTKKQIPFNPMIFNIDVIDTKKPVIQKLFLFHENNFGEEVINQKIDIEKVKDGLYKAPNIYISGKIGIGLQMYDNQDLSQFNRNGIYSIKIFLNNKLITHYNYNSIKFDDSEYVNLLIDYKEFKTKKVRVQKLFYPNNSNISFIEKEEKNGKFLIEEDKSYDLLIEISDFKKNTSKIEMKIIGRKTNFIDPTIEGELILPENEYLLKFKNQTVHFKKNTFFYPTFLNVYKDSDSIKINPDITLFKKSYSIEFISKDYDSISKRQSFIARLNKKNKIDYLPTKFIDSVFKTKSIHAGTYFLAKDSTPPTIKPINFIKNQWLSNSKFLKIKIEDDLSGIKSYKGEINGKWVLFEYEPKKKNLTYDFNDIKFKSGKQDLNIKVTDNVGNESVFKTSFYRKYD